ncbi:DUF7500 family protein [Halobellus captivus]|uniref:DUF7500 family protein n=1 Tax=Halobellus captivus TaxID=2592614 RepID=UPI0011A3564E|nr:hypothetical protein [Halobellus captivus]
MPPSDPPDDVPASASSEDGVVRPDDLDYTVSERVAELEEGRYVIATDNDDSPSVDTSQEEGSVSEDERGTLARQQMNRYVSDREGAYGFALTAAFNGEVAQHERFTDDVATAFGELVQWYVEQIDTEASPSEAIGILLLASETTVSYPTNTLASILRQQNLTLNDSIADLVEALSDEKIQIPPEE